MHLPYIHRRILFDLRDNLAKKLKKTGSFFFFETETLNLVSPLFPTPAHSVLPILVAVIRVGVIPVGVIPVPPPSKLFPVGSHPAKKSFLIAGQRTSQDQHLAFS